MGNNRVARVVLTSQIITDPFSLSSEASTVKDAICAKLKFGFFRLNAEYHL
ncbi:hypothetical protein [Winogradskyella sp.]|uniref:DUF6588 family protein n=1 Tax=Winogradskyella sp. TaxID=1883156 RepID=UPI003424B767